MASLRGAGSSIARGPRHAGRETRVGIPGIAARHRGSGIRSTRNAVTRLLVPQAASRASCISGDRSTRLPPGGLDKTGWMSLHRAVAAITPSLGPASGAESLVPPGGSSIPAGECSNPTGECSGGFGECSVSLGGTFVFFGECSGGLVGTSVGFGECSVLLGGTFARLGERSVGLDGTFVRLGERFPSGDGTLGRSDLCLPFFTAVFALGAPRLISFPRSSPDSFLA
jgi:hypothetical protein